MGISPAPVAQDIYKTKLIGEIGKKKKKVSHRGRCSSKKEKDQNCEEIIQMLDF